MFKALKMKIAARRMERKSTARKSAKENKRTFWNYLQSAIKKTSDKIISWLRSFWNWVRNIDLIGLVNATLLSAIIVLFSMLIIDIIGYNKQSVVILAQQNAPQHQQIEITNQSAPRSIQERADKPALPLKRDENRQFVGKPIEVAHVKPDNTAIKQTARTQNVMYGDIIIDSRGAATMLKTGDVIKGNLYLQNMRKYILPRGIRIEGNLFLRDMGMLQFAGEFTVTGNIYVTPTSSFGPLPSTARIGGQVIL